METLFSVIIIIGLFPNLGASPTTLEHLESTIISHSQSIMRLNSYLRKTDHFLAWYNKNYRKLNNLMGDEITDGVSLQDILQRLQRLEENQSSQNQDSPGNVKLQARIQQLEDKVKEKEDEIKNIREAFGGLSVITLQNRIQQLEGKMRDKENEITSMREEFVGGRNNMMMFVRQTTQKSNHSTQILIEKIKVLQDDRMAATDSFVHLNSTIDDISSQMINLTHSIQNDDDFERRLHQLENKNDTGSEIPNRLDADIADNGIKIQQLESAAQTRDRKLIEMNNKLHNLDTQSRNTNTRFESVQRSVETVSNEAASLRSSIAEIDGRLNNVKNKVAGVASNLETTKTDISALKNKIENTEEKVNEMAATPTSSPSSSMSEIRMKLEELEKKIEAKKRIREQGDEVLNRIISRSSAASNSPAAAFGNEMPPPFAQTG